MTSTRLAVLVSVASFLLGAIVLIGSLILGARGVPGSDTFLALTTAYVGGIAAFWFLLLRPAALVVKEANCFENSLKKDVFVLKFIGYSSGVDILLRLHERHPARL
jgi:hypothetical protein